MTDHDASATQDDPEPGPTAGTDTGNAAETTDADELLGDIATGANDDPGKGAD
jgi:hypothetical protein